MEIGTINNLNLTEKQIEEVVQKKVNNEVKKIVDKVKAQLPTKLAVIKKEIFANFQMIGSTEILKVFLETYGSNFDVGSLQSSLFFSITNDLRPMLSYNKAVFQFNSSLKKNIRSFNKNARKDTNFSETMGQEEFDTIEDEDMFYEDNAWDEAWNEVESNIFNDDEVFSPHNKMLQQGGYSNLDETYQKAINSALKAFYDRYNSYIKPMLIKKYGIKL